MAEGSLLPPLRGEKATGEFPFRDLEDRLLFGDLPGIATIVVPEERREVLRSYVTAHLEEEIRRETAIRDYGLFLRFLRFAAAESGGILNLQALSRESGLSAPTIRAHYQLLEDMFLGYTIPAFSGSPRKSALSSPRFLFFDLGMRNAAARLHLDMDTVRANPGPLFKQWVGGEIYKRLRYKGSGTLSYFRTSAGAEVDFIIEDEGSIYPIEVKWTERPTLSDAKHMLAFMKDHPDRARRGYIVCRCPYPLELSGSISAIPWWGL
ncbi:MAG: ATP-binding protein [Rectinemataceae bacterium]